MALIEFKNLPDTTTPLTAQNLNNNFNYLTPSVYCVRVSSNHEWTSATQYAEELIPFDTGSGSNSDFSLSSGKIKINGNISKVLVSINLDDFGSQDQQGIVVYINQTPAYPAFIITPATTMYRLNTVANILLDVNQNDEIYFTQYSNSMNQTRTISNRTIATIQKVA